ncbi:sensor domain-containing protein [Nocardiopsis sp. RSe5-2]|uniref:Sensor domain-containing protein n=1 Tax=Nocardiopsis endophytica TaxID=3018445 RepID=A0ABT4U9W7_9ACTN|nr:sensor domain-containing protein [Nocardiopsis endophytica]MDA2813531.1 sensor domain-containing protein [Nocardiopsis endophytica]
MQKLIRRLGADTGYVLIGFPTAVIAFAVTVAGLAAGAGTAVIVAGLFVLTGALLAARMAASVERNMLAHVIGRPLGAPRYCRAPAGSSWFRTALTPLTCGQSWMDAGHALIRLPVATATFVVVVACWGVALAGVAYPLYGWVLYSTVGSDGGLPELIGLGDSLTVSVLFHTAVGLLFAVNLPFVARGAAGLNAALAQAFLSPYAPAYEEPEPGRPAAPAPASHTPTSNTPAEAVAHGAPLHAAR